MVSALEVCHYFRSRGWFLHDDLDEMMWTLFQSLQVVDFNIVSDVGSQRGHIEDRSWVTDTVFYLDCSHSRKAEGADRAELQSEC